MRRPIRHAPSAANTMTTASRIVTAATDVTSVSPTEAVMPKNVSTSARALGLPSVSAANDDSVNGWRTNIWALQLTSHFGRDNHLIKHARQNRDNLNLNEVAEDHGISNNRH